MPSSKLIRWSGPAGVVSGVLWLAVFVILFRTEQADGTVLGLTLADYHSLLNPVLLLFMLGLVGFYARQGGGSGKLGLTGLIIGLIGLATTLVGNVIEYGILGGRLLPESFEPGGDVGWGAWETFILGTLLMLPVGLVLVGIAALRAKAMERWSSAVPMIIGLVMFAASVLGGLLGDARWFKLAILAPGLGWVLMGYALWSTMDTSRSEQAAA